MQYIFILKNGSEKQKPDAGELGNDRRYLQRGSAGRGSENDNNDNDKKHKERNTIVICS